MPITITYGGAPEQFGILHLPGRHHDRAGGPVPELFGGTPEQVPDRYAAARPQLDAGPTMVSVVGTNDDIVPPRSSIDPNLPDAIEVVEVTAPTTRPDRSRARSMGGGGRGPRRHR